VRVRRATYDPLGAETITFELGSVDDPEVHTTTRARFLAPTR
jgi:hypothetical protein